MATEIARNALGRLAHRMLRRPKLVDESALRGFIDRGEQARRALSEPAIVEMFAHQEASYHEAWRATGLPDVEAREHCWLALGVLDDLKQFLSSRVREGEAAREQLEKLRAAEARQ